MDFCMVREWGLLASIRWKIGLSKIPLGNGAGRVCARQM